MVMRAMGPGGADCCAVAVEARRRPRERSRVGEFRSRVGKFGSRIGSLSFDSIQRALVWSVTLLRRSHPVNRSATKIVDLISYCPVKYNRRGLGTTWFMEPGSGTFGTATRWIEGIELKTLPVVGDSFTYPFSISQEQIARFAELTGDTNPIHVDTEAAAAGEFGGPIAHGVLILGVFSKIFGTILYSDGQVVLGLDIRFLAPVRPELSYTAVVTVMETLLKKNQIVYRTEVFGEDGTEVLKGSCRILNRKHYIAEPG